LCNVEHREPFQKRDRLGFAALPQRPLAFVIGRETISIDDRCAALAAANVAAQMQVG